MIAGYEDFVMRLRDEGEAFILSLIGSQEETLNIEFKSAADESIFSEGRLTKHGRSVLAKEMSAFANTSGGVIIVGVRCRKNADDIDIADAAEPIPDLAKSTSSVAENLAQLTQFAVPGADSFSIPAAGSDERGYIAVVVPASDARPHRAESKEFKSYYLRSGSSAVEMPHRLVVDQARRIDRPKIELDCQIERVRSEYPDSDDDEVVHHHMIMQILLKNSGNATAKHISLLIENSENSNVIMPSNFPVGPTAEAKNGTFDLHFPMNLVVHPRQTRRLCAIDLHLRITRGDKELRVGSRGQRQNRLRFRACAFAEGAELAEMPINLGFDELAAMAAPREL